MLAAKGDHVLAWPEGRLLIMTEGELQDAYDVVSNGAGAKWTEHRRARGTAVAAIHYLMETGYLVATDHTHIMVGQSRLRAMPPAGSV